MLLKHLGVSSMPWHWRHTRRETIARQNASQKRTDFGEICFRPTMLRWPSILHTCTSCGQHRLTLTS